MAVRFALPRDLAASEMLAYQSLSSLRNRFQWASKAFMAYAFCLSASLYTYRSTIGGHSPWSCDRWLIQSLAQSDYATRDFIISKF